MQPGTSTAAPIRVAFLGCGFITGVHSRHLKALRGEVVCRYASRDLARAEQFSNRYGGHGAYGDYSTAIADPDVDAVVVAVPPRLHRDLTLDALRAGKHVLVEKPAFLSLGDYETVCAARDQVDRVVLVGENDHYKPLAVTLRKLLSAGVIGDLVLAQFTTVAQRPKKGDDWRNDEELAGGDAFFEEGIHWLHLAGSLGPTITRIDGYRPAPAPDRRPDEDRRVRSMLVAFAYDNGAVGALYYSREIPSLLRGVRVSKLYGRGGVITFESNGGGVLVRGRGLPRIVFPGVRDVRGYEAMYRDFTAAIRTGRRPEMGLERAMADHRLMERVYGNSSRGLG
ncbi:MAG TPA: Gfo/Idh/MocA family oxidoreductase [Nocardioidaceae bacterium]|nr:Gfo/Idh/MocA family oxidoreductase [Nocardioidaceae bacterium]